MTELCIACLKSVTNKFDINMKLNSMHFSVIDLNIFLFMSIYYFGTKQKLIVYNNYCEP